jgi:hypothetical protein
LLRIGYSFQRSTKPEHSHERNVVLLGMNLACVAFVAGCGLGEITDGLGGEKAADELAGTTAEKTKQAPEQTAARSGDDAEAGDAEARDGKVRAEDAVAGDGEARAGGIVAGDDAEEAVCGSGSRPGKVRLRIGGMPGAAFSGMCAVGGEKRKSGAGPWRG